MRPIMEWEEHYGVATTEGYKGCEYVFLVCEWFINDDPFDQEGFSKQGVTWSLRVTPEGKLIECIEEREIDFLARLFCGPEGAEKVTRKYEREIKQPT